MKKWSYAFTLTEALIALAIIGVLGALYIPSIVVDTKQREYKTALRKAVNALNNSISLNMVLEGDSPSYNANLFGYLQRHMFIYKSTTQLSFSAHNYAFYTTDGIRFEFPTQKTDMNMELKLHERNSGDIIWNNFDIPKRDGGRTSSDYIGHCGSRGLPIALEGMRDYPCLILVDVNGDKKPNPAVTKNDAATFNDYVFAYPDDKYYKDVFTVMITNNMAVPFGTVAQRAMYDADRKKRKKK